MRISVIVFAATLAAAADSSLEKGRALYRSNCAFCHGLTGLGGRGPDLVSGARKPDEEVKRIIREGVPGSTMPAFSSFERTELDNLVVFLKHLAGTVTTAEPVKGNTANGAAIYQKNGCAGCHQIGDAGSSYGPDLTRIGSSRSAQYLRESIVKPSHDIPPKYEGVTAVLRNGQKVSGIRVNEDTFTLQVRLPNETFRSFFKDRIAQVVYSGESVMPPYKLPPGDLDDLVAFLTTLRGQARSGAQVKQAEGIR